MWLCSLHLQRAQVCRCSPQGQVGKKSGRAPGSWARTGPSPSILGASNILGNMLTDRQFTKVFPQINLKIILKPKPEPSPWRVLLITVNQFSWGQTPGSHRGPGHVWEMKMENILHNLNPCKKREGRAETIWSQSNCNVTKSGASSSVALPATLQVGGWPRTSCWWRASDDQLQRRRPPAADGRGIIALRSQQGSPLQGTR